jgi:hypothetical protein
MGNLFAGFTADELDQFCTKMENAIATHESMGPRIDTLYLAPPSVVMDEIIGLHGDAVLELVKVLYA